MLDKIFNPAATEAKWYQHWVDAGYFLAGANARPGAERFVVMIPPPNVTGSLHMGHALNNTLQDILVRVHRMKGYDVLWQPGTDHAGIATQMVVERQLASEGVNRRDMGRGQFLSRVWTWKEQSGGTIISQLKRLGASCDWSRERFTMDEGFSRAVIKVFVELYRKGLIYRAKRLVNWDPKFQTAVSDLEVENRETKGKFWHFAYPLEDGSGEIVIATTRPETMLGDGAVAVHPSDARYTHMVGKKVRLPLADRLIPIIADEYPDPEKGSGAVKITGAHDFNDFVVAQRHNIPFFPLMDAEARMAGQWVPEKYRGMDRYEARKAIVEDIDALGLLRQVEDRVIMQPFGDRSNVVIEPMLTDQWFVDAEKLAVDALAAVKDGRTKFVPENWDKTYFNWLTDIQPWCVSRQLWWGHQIPAWYDADGNIFVAETEAEAQTLAGAGIDLRRDEDVLDTWFSSALWPFGTLGWPDDTEALKRYYPGSVLVTGFDIIFFWVARMMMQGLEFMGEPPFHTVYVHGLVRDAKGKKMSKSAGNVIDPLEFMDKYGADALRFTMAAMETQGRDIKLSEKRVEGYRNFATKLWNAARFCQMNGIGGCDSMQPPSASLTLNRWLIAEVAATLDRMNAALAAYRFDDLASAIYSFVWDRFCDWYLELAKPVLTGEDAAEQAETRAVAGWALDQILVMLHPLMPFITEELWHALKPDRVGDLAVAAWPDYSGVALDPQAGQQIDWLIAVVSAIRSARTEVNVPPGAQLPCLVAYADPATADLIAAFETPLKRLARLESIALADAPPATGALQVVVQGVTYGLQLGDVIDLAAERARLAKRRDKLEAEAAAIRGRLGSPAFVDKAPEEVIEENRTKLAAAEAETVRIAQALECLV
ncbi:MAG: valine--tRNA ligase [Sphingomonadales bacterium]|nr:MAG: valine--tRNA ligase [Sphingomonadales bacterium]